jgi:hypothetical protein
MVLRATGLWPTFYALFTNCREGFFSEIRLPPHNVLGNSGARRAKEEGRGSAPSPTETPGLRDPLTPLARGASG